MQWRTSCWKPYRQWSAMLCLVQLPNLLGNATDAESAFHPYLPCKVTDSNSKSMGNRVNHTWTCTPGHNSSFYMFIPLLLRLTNTIPLSFERYCHCRKHTSTITPLIFLRSQKWKQNWYWAMCDSVAFGIPWYSIGHLS